MISEKIYYKSPYSRGLRLVVFQRSVANFMHFHMNVKKYFPCLLIVLSFWYANKTEAQITGPTEVCVGQTATFVLDSDPCIADIEWMEIAGYYEIVGPNNAFEVDIHFYTATPVIEICVRYFNTCESKVEEKCHVVAVVELPPTTVEEDLCIGGCTVVAGEEFCDPGVYEVTLTSSQGCDSLVIVVINPVGPSIINLGPMIVGCNDPIEICGEPLFSAGVHTVYCQGNGDCDSIFIVELIGDTVIAEAGPNIQLFCFGGETLYGDGSSTGPEYSYLWTSPQGYFIENHTTLFPYVYISGWYYLTVTNEITGCEAVDSVRVYSGGGQIEIEIEPTEINCEEEEVTLNAVYSGVSGPVNFFWTTSNGNIVSGANTLNPVIDAPGEYCLQVNSVNCFEMECIDVEKVEDIDIDGPSINCSPGDSVTHTVSSCPPFEATSFFLQVDNGPVMEIMLAPGQMDFEWTNMTDTAVILTAWAVDGSGIYSDTTTLEVDYFSVDVNIVIEEVTCQGILLEDIYTYNTSYNGVIETEWSTGGGTNAFVTQPGWVSVTRSFPLNGCQISDSILITSDMFMNCAQVNGFVLVDANNNCQTDLGEMPLSGWLVAAEGTNGIFYGTTDSDGFYSISVPPGNYIVTLTPGSNVYDVCSNDVGIVLPDANSSVQINFSVFEKTPCPVLTVDISNNILRRCADNNFFFVKYCNEGTAAATDAYVEITLDPDLSFVFSPANYTHVSGQIYSFEIGNLDPDECGEFWFKAFLDCDVEIAETHCTEAHIFPDDACMPANPLWSGASLEVRASCSDSTRFTITNVGSAAVTNPLSYLVIEDAVMYRPGEILALAPGESMVVTLPANGSTWRLEVEQERFHPSATVPVAWIEGCGDNMTGTFSRGFVNQRFLADSDLYLDTDCTQNQAPFDPNDKQGFPLGHSQEHFVKKENQIEYLVRFQNTGNDTAINVILLDTLDKKLDLTTLRPGAASHFYEYEIFGTGILKFSFPNINLPDSTSNFIGSQGFVQFIVSPKEDVLPGEVIENDADIYFDSNPPVTTNTTFHTIEKPKVFELQSAEICSGETFNGIEITADTMIVETISLPLYDSLIFYNLQALPNLETVVSANVCEGDGYFFDGNNLTQAGTYQSDLTSENGCDSTVVLTFSLLENAFTEMSAQICAGSNYNFYGEMLTEEGTYQHLLQSVNGCDSLVELQLTVTEGFETSTTAAVCEGDSYDFYGQTLTSSGVYETVLTSFGGCDSLVVLVLEVFPNYAPSIAASICEGSSYDFNGQELTEGGMYEANFVSKNGCDSLVTLELSFFENEPVEIGAEICEGGEYLFGNQTLTVSGQYEKVFTSVQGCDSMVVLTLEVTDILNEDIFINICHGDSYELGGEILTEQGHYEWTTTSSEGCDSTVVLTLDFWPVYNMERAAIICLGDSAEFNGNTYFETGVYTATLTTIHGCDSTITLDLTVKDSLGSDFSDAICEGEIFDFNGEALTEPGTYETAFSSLEGCDSTVTLYLEVEPVFADTLFENVPHGDFFNGVQIFTDTVFLENLLALNGCDSIVTTFVSPVTNTSENLAELIDLHIFPNPTDGHFYVQFNLGEIQNMQVKIFDVIGQQVVFASKNGSYAVGEHLLNFNTSDWISGVYLIHFQIDSGVVTERLVVK